MRAGHARQVLHRLVSPLHGAVRCDILCLLGALLLLRAVRSRLCLGGSRALSDALWVVGWIRGLG